MTGKFNSIFLVEKLKHLFCGLYFLRYKSKAVKHEKRYPIIVDASVGVPFQLFFEKYDMPLIHPT